jgi:hypothetical protein
MDNQTTTTTTVITDAPATDPSPVIVNPTIVVSTPKPDQGDPDVRNRNSIGYYLTLGIRGLLGSKKGTFAILVLVVTTVALFLGKITGETYVAALSIMAGIYSAASAAVDMKNGAS